MARVARDSERLAAAAELLVASLVEVGHVLFSWRTAWRVFASPQAVRTYRTLVWWSMMSMGYMMCADVADAISQLMRLLRQEWTENPGTYWRRLQTAPTYWRRHQSSGSK
ncbi:hypothetical protein N9L68_08000 [bacterium]|nr:hypothetical protein [bacterium]